MRVGLGTGIGIAEYVAGIAYHGMRRRLTGHGTYLVSWLEAQAMACTVSERDDRMGERGGRRYV